LLAAPGFEAVVLEEGCNLALAHLAFSS